MNEVIYFDHAATSWPKPPQVAVAMQHFLTDIGANPGRSGHHLSVEAARVVYDAREAVADLFQMDDPLRVVFEQNATGALNLALFGLLLPGQHVITSSMEHNSVMRPLRELERSGVHLTVIPCSASGQLDPDDVRRAIQPETKLIVLTHASNVTGTLLPIREVGIIAREHDLLLLVDAAQTAGAYPLSMIADHIDLLAFTGHKALHGPMGTGGLVVGDRVDLARMRPLKYGGTGSRSERETQPEFLPDRFESGTPNAVGLAGLAAGIRQVQATGIQTIRAHEVLLTQHLIDGLRAVPGVRVYGTGEATQQVATVAFNLDGFSPADVGLYLDEERAILCRIGLHCAPAAHRTLGTFPGGTVRFGLGYTNTIDEINVALDAIQQLARRVIT